MRSVILGTAGHVDHGKTALVEALTGVNTDRWEEERERGITIDLGFARFPSDEPDLEISVVDVPGHEDFVKNMLAGATGIDLLLLVVAADEGPMPQTREHLWIARLLGVRRGVVAITKSDLVEPDWCGLVAESVREELQTVFGPVDWPLVVASAVTGEGVTELKAAIDAAARAVEAREEHDLFRLPVDRSFSVRGVGTVVTGTVWSGHVDVGRELRVLPGATAARVRGIQIHGAEAERAHAGQRAALALASIDRDEVERGRLLVSDPVWRATRQLDARIHTLAGSPWPIRHWQRVRFHLGTAEVLARVVLPQGVTLRPGEGGIAQLRLEGPVVARAGDRFVLRFYSPVTTIGGGVVIDPWARRRGRAALAAAAAEENLVELDPGERVGRAVARQETGASAEELAVLAGLRPGRVDEALSGLATAGAVREVGGRWYSKEALEAVRRRVLDVLDSEHRRDSGARGVSLEALRGAAGPGGPLVDDVLADLEAAGAVRVEGSVAARAGHVPTLDPEDRALADDAVARLQRDHLAPPGLKELAAELRVAPSDLLRVLKFLAERGVLVAVTPDLYYHVDAFDEVRNRVREALEGGRPGRPSELREALGVSRKYLIPLLEYLDAAGFTRRTPAGRVLREGM
ncbi:MAG: selenocysteine-specific translation elongation factor [Gemmatimonadetes bacterium]|uniref:Selenocysteine-specific elongation factor n=1 Tax=Candidatus Kutchimonas denitrificans TaxID=3056748 RepID=A0AAE5CBD5_9BACT|nr:selenocysteine-specific translation elongation factor [Gemmatimonadota bacterium]NIR75707.1 selenocysteine-specific translation elongation factor [Candidatus Kutchimonas denitrificans]NIS00320.1 selenocysteine-specific translation elongation factor [Gemmatimonadota bacterium]NIT65979.1 selenocysteine-specific translation elongation factor [Gemmatimonadota bacterium]NIU53683.1 selenocysteine-specific translation elongation factor [Gemmatimonadota bacterium]